MLAYQINGKDSEVKYKVIDTETLTADGEKIIVSAPSHLMRSNDMVYAIRREPNMFCMKSFWPEIVSIDEFKIDSLPPLPVPVSDAWVDESYPVFIQSGWTETENKRTDVVTCQPCLILEMDEEHYFVHEKTFDSISEVIYDTPIEDTDDEMIAYYSANMTPYRRCVGDYALFNGFLFQSIGLTDDGLYILDDEPVNYSSVTLTYTDISGSTCTLTDGFVPLGKDGFEDRNRLVFKIGDECLRKRADNIVENLDRIEFTTKDERFWVEGEGGNLEFVTGWHGEETSYLSRREGDYRLDISAEDVFATNLHSSRELNAYMNSVGESNYPKVIDYEKKCFVPAEVRSGVWTPSVNRVKFNLHFRERADFTHTGTTENISNTEWLTDDTLGWFGYIMSATEIIGPMSSIIYTLTQDPSYPYDNSTGAQIPHPERNNRPNVLGHLGYTYGDVYYQKNSLKKSFIRLLFYDSKDRRTQVLQGYATIFYDTGEAYQKLISYKAKDMAKYADDNLICEEEVSDIDKRIEASFYVEGRRNMQRSSEGFYIYLFPSLLNSLNEGTLYMKVEFNHAKYGYTIPMICPIDSEGAISPTSGNFPCCYVDRLILDGTPKSGSEKVEYDKLLSDTYIKVNLKYDIDTKTYMYSIPELQNDNHEIVVELYEPRVNG